MKLGRGYTQTQQALEGWREGIDTEVDTEDFSQASLKCENRLAFFLYRNFKHELIGPTTTN